MQPPTSSTNSSVLLPTEKQSLNPSLFSFTAGPPGVLQEKLAALILLHCRFAKHIYPQVWSLPAETQSKAGRGRRIILQPELAQLGGAFREKELRSVAGTSGQGQECKCLTLLNCPPGAERWELFIKCNFPVPIRLQILQ